MLCKNKFGSKCKFSDTYRIKIRINLIIILSSGLTDTKISVWLALVSCQMVMWLTVIPFAPYSPPFWVRNCPRPNSQDFGMANIWDAKRQKGFDFANDAHLKKLLIICDRIWHLNIVNTLWPICISNICQTAKSGSFFLRVIFFGWIFINLWLKKNLWIYFAFLWRR